MKKHLLKSLLALALVLITGNAWGADYKLVTSTSDLVAGCKYVIGSAANGAAVFMSTEANANNRKTTSASVADSKVALTTDMLVLQLGGESGAWTLQTTNYASTDGYLASAASGKNNYCRVITDVTTCAISFSSNAAVITLNPHTERNILRYNSNNGTPIFACYSSGQSPVYLFKEESTTPSKTLTSVAVSGTPTKTAYEVGEEFDPAGLVVIGTYDDASTDEVTSGIEWTVTPSGALTVGTTSVDVIATVGEVSSVAYTVSELTVNEHVITPGTYEIIPNISFFGIPTQTTGSHDAVTGSQNDITISHSGGSNFYCNDSQIRTYKNNTLTISVPDGYEITLIVLACTDNAEFAASAGTYTSNTKSWVGNANSVVLTSGQSSGNYQITKITVTYAAATVKTLESISVTNPKTEFYKGDTFEFGGTVTASYEEDDVEDEDVTSQATFEGYDMSAAGTQAVTVTYKEKQTTYQITVNTIANTLATAYTTGAAIELIDAGKDLATEVYVKGRISEIVKYESGKITYWLDDKTFEVYHGKNLENTSFTSANDIEVGADVVVYGKIKKYSSIYEFDEGNYLVSYSEPTKTGATIELGTYKTTLKVGDADDEYEVTYDGDGELSITSSDEDVAEAIIIDGNVLIEAKAAGTTTITISAPETDNYYSATKSYTLKVVGPASLPFAYDGGKDNLSTGMTQSGLGTDYASAPKLKFDTTGDNLVIWFGEKAGFVSYAIKGNSFSGGTFEVMESADGNDYSAVATHTELGDVETMTNALKSDTRYVKFIYTNKDDGNVALGSIKICRARDVTIASSGKSTLYLDYAATVPEGVKAYYATGYDSTNDIVTMTEVTDNTIAKNQGVMLMGEAGETYTFEETVDVDAPTTNYFGGSATGMNMNDKTGEDGYYILQGGQFAPISDGDLPAYKAYLYLEDRPYTGQGSTIGFRFGDATQIENVNAVEAGKYFDLMGCEVLNPAGGIYILNGKKVLVK